MIVVADTSPLNYLILLEHSEILPQIYGRILAPQAVLTEMQHPEAPPQVRAWAVSPPSWLEAKQVSQIDETLSAELGAGEREAISLALEVNANVLLIDERAGRHEAEERKLQVAGTLAVLLQASMVGNLDFPDILKRLRSHGFRLSKAVETAVLLRYKQAKAQKP